MAVKYFPRPQRTLAGFRESCGRSRQDSVDLYRAKSSPYGQETGRPDLVGVRINASEDTGITLMRLFTQLNHTDESELCQAEKPSELLMELPAERVGPRDLFFRFEIRPILRNHKGLYSSAVVD